MNAIEAEKLSQRKLLGLDARRAGFDAAIGGMRKGSEQVVSVLLRSVGERYVTQVTTEHHAVLADEPRPEGDDLGPSPYELLLAAVGACTSMTLLMYARRRAWPLAAVQIELTHDRDYVRDCGNCEEATAGIEAIERRIHLEGPLTDDQRERLMTIATHCPVHKTLASAPAVIDTLV